MEDVIVRCPNCNQANRVREVLPGKRPICGRCKTPLATGRPVALTAGSFEKFVEGPRPAIVDFWADWCGPCHAMAPTFEALASSRSDIAFGKLDIDAHRSIAGRYNVSTIPTLVFFEKGAEKGRVVGSVGRGRIESAIAQYFER